MKRKKWIKVLSLLFSVMLLCVGVVGCEQSDEENLCAADFVLTISTSKNKFQRNDEIKVEIMFKNISEMDVEIAYYHLITPFIPTATNYPTVTEMPPAPYIEKVVSQQSIVTTNDLGGYFESGKHEIKYKAQFYLNWGKETEQMFVVWSNVIYIEVEESL